MNINRSMAALSVGVVLLLDLLVSRVWSAEPYTKREAIEWCNIWIPSATSTNLPRVLLLGDSITAQYSGGVDKELNGKAYVAMLATSKAVGDPALLEEVKLVLSQGSFAVIHFNNGLHGGEGYTVEDYRKGFPDLIATLKRYAPNAKLIWATTTPCRSKDTTSGVQERNRIAAEFVAKEGMAVDDLYGLIANGPDLWSDGVHYKPEGVALQAKQVAASIRTLLPPQP